jgi:site-specific recombinase
VLLFLSSLIAGWFENFSLVTNLPKRLEYNSFLRSAFGVQRLHRFAVFLEKHSNALGANISLGLLLGLTPQFLKFFAIPIEVRHVTLATGSFATALPQIIASSGFSVWDFMNTVSGLILIGVVNILVSFSLAVALACASLHTRVSTLLALLKWASLRILSKPWLLIVPPRIRK